jgi:hypothetical protein
MATTTNYGWTTPDDTALVKDGAAAIRTLGSSVDTTTKNLNPSTTLGDIEYRSSTANTNTRLGIGTTGQLLTVAGGVPTWATPAGGGGMTLLQTLTLSGNSVTSSSFATTYKKLAWIFYNVDINALAQMDIRVNSLSTSIYQNNYIEGSSFTYGRTGATTSINGTNWVGASGINISGYGEINNYGNTGNNFKSGFVYNAADGNRWFNQNTFGISTAAAISTLTFLTSDPARTFNGGTIDLYGVN